ncbi:DUF4347 domain-containing protein [Geitlerinema sp. PCC 9228]|uniref:DUF4347 domain-containing protein n=1 Tax=Geitlerinema sp. PCC 9228 TaxID=111611 RepID=UPI0008F9B78D|nr:DUF4347 domain-containing protein [Geitlerinema sp. PCC 9228]
MIAIDRISPAKTAEGNLDDRAIAFIDPAVENYPQLLAGLLPGITPIVLKRDRDGIEQITEILLAAASQKSPNHYQAIHLISHGAAGCLNLGNTRLTLETLPQYSQQLQQWRQALVTNADLLIYGCNVAAFPPETSNGIHPFLLRLHQLTQANIAASNRFTGNSSKGGNWQLEIQIGRITHGLAFSQKVQQEYAGILANITVTNTNDDLNGSTTSITDLQNNPGVDGISLREAIAAANNTAGADTILLASSVTGSIVLDGNPLQISDDLTIDGPGASYLKIDANNTSRVVSVTEDVPVTLEGITITGGLTSSGGGGIYSVGNLTLENSVVTGNTISGGEFADGAGIYIQNSNLTILNSVISSNTGSDSVGGGIAVRGDGTVTISNSTLSENTSVVGGGLSVQGNGDITISNSSILANTSGIGGGIYINGNGNATITNSTISDNSTDVSNVETSHGGGIAIQESENITITNSTISGNTAGGSGGGISILSINNNASSSILNSTISGNKRWWHIYSIY